MAKLTEEESINLSNNLKKLRERTGYSSKYVATQAGISQRTYENYLNIESGASLKSLEKLATFFETTVDILIAPNMAGKEIELQHALKMYEPILAKKTSTYFDKIHKIMEKLCGKDFTALINLVKQQDFNVVYMPTFSPDEISTYQEKKYDEQYDRKTKFDNPNTHKELKDAATKMFEFTKSSYIDRRITCELFIDKYNNDEFDNIKPEDLPIEIRFEQSNEFKSLEDFNKIQNAEDLTFFSSDHTVSEIMELLESVQDCISDFIFSE